MRDSCVQYSDRIPEQGHSHVRAHHHWSQPQWEDVGEDMFQRVRVHRCDARRGCPLVMDLVDMLVQPRVMQQSASMQTYTYSLPSLPSKATITGADRCQPVAVVETNLFNDEETEEVPECGGEGGQLVAHFTSTPLQQGISHYIKHHTHYARVEQTQLEGFLVLGPADLVDKDVIIPLA